MPVQDDSQVESVYEEVSKSQYQPFDPEAVQPTSSPAPSTQSGDIGDTSGADGEAGTNQAQDLKDPPPAFDERYREPFTGLLYVGALTDHFTLWGHEFVIKTLTTEDIAEIGLLVKEYEGTIAQNAVYQAATIAMAVLSVDGQPLPLPLVQGDSGIHAKYTYVAKNWYPPVRAKVWERYFQLETVVSETVEAMGKVSG